MGLMRIFVAVVAMWAIWLQAEIQAAEPLAQAVFPLSFKIIDPDSPQKAPPYIVMFEGGVDRDGRDVRGPLGRLKMMRGASKMFPESNRDPGLPVVLRGIRFYGRYNADGSLAACEVELQGEYNAVRVPTQPNDMKALLAGQRTTFSLVGQKDYRIYAYVSTVKLEVQLVGDQLLIFDVVGDFNFREARSTHISKPKRLTPPPGREFLYRGERGELPNLPVI